jgi:hypothetical protein
MRKSDVIDLVIVVAATPAIYVLLRLVREHLTGSAQALAYGGVVVTATAILKLLNRWIHPEKYKQKDSKSDSR